MIGLVRLALRRPYTQAVAAMLIMLMGALSVTRMVVDIFPNIDIPVVYVAWNYPGLTAEDMERRVVLVSERAYSTTVNGIERIESQSIPGHRHASRSISSRAPTSAAPSRRSPRRTTRSCASRRPACTPPNDHPVQRLERAGGAGHAQQQDAARAADLRLRPQLPPREAVHHPGPVDARRLTAASSARSSSMSTRRGCSAKGLSPMDVVNALQTTNVIVPAGVARIGEREYNVKLNSSPQFGRPVQGLPVGVCDGVPVSLGDVAQGQRQLRHADQHRAHQRPARQLPAHPEELRRLDACGGQGHPRRALPEIQAARAGGPRAEARLRPVGVRAGAVENVIHEAILVVDPGLADDPGLPRAAGGTP